MDLYREVIMNLTDRYTWDETAGRKLADFSTNGKKDNVDREALYKKEQKNRIKIRDLQKRLYADQREGLIVIIVGMEASGKDRIIRKLVGALDPQGISVERYIHLEKKDIKHDMLQRVHMNVPERGEIAILSGTYYEDMLWYAVKGEALPIRVAPRIDKKIAYESHFKYARDFEEYLYGSSYRVVKIYLNLSLKKQKKRLLKRFGDPEQNWSLGPEVLDDRMKWFEYQKTIEKIIKATATEHSPWYVIPADRKWYANYLVSEVLLRVMEEMDPHFPPAAAEEGFSVYREALLSGKFDRKAILQRCKKKEEARGAVEEIPEAPAAPSAEEDIAVEPDAGAETVEALNPEKDTAAAEDMAVPNTEGDTAAASDAEESAADPDTETAETAAAAEEKAPAPDAVPEASSDTVPEPPEKPAPGRRRTRKTAEDNGFPEAGSSAPKSADSAKTAGSAKKAGSGKEKESSGETPKRRQARKDGPPKTVEETLARRARRRGGS